MTATGALAWTFQAITCALAVAVSRRRPAHRPFMAWALLALTFDVGRSLSAIPFPWLLGKEALGGVQRAIFHVDQALFLAEPIGLVAVAWIAFLGRRPWLPLAVGALVWLALVLGYPEPFRGAVLGKAYAAVQASAIVAALGAMAAWSRRRAHPRPEHAATSLATLIAAALFAGPYAPPCPAPFDAWNSAELVFLALWAAEALLHALALGTGGFGLRVEPGRRETSARLH